MSSLNIVSSEREIFKCPSCNQFTSSNTCAKCSYQVSDELKRRLAVIHSDEVKGENNKFFMRFVYTGSALLAIGLILILWQIAGDEKLTLRGFGLTFGGIGSILWGLKGIYKD